jgi:membrane protein DedA with SNARE-associated domain
MADVTQSVLEFVRNHAGWAPPVVFVLAFCESFGFVSLLVPATVILFGVGGLMGLSGVEFGAIWLAAAAGAVLGDWLAYELAYYFKDRIVRVWPLSRHPGLVRRGFDFFQRWGVLAVFIGRFFGPLRAVVPLVAGILGMRILPFQLANVSSAVVWATGILGPGYFGLHWWSGD